MNFRTNIFYLLTVAILTLLPQESVYAQKLSKKSDITAQSAYEFARTHGGDKYLGFLKKMDDEDKKYIIVCGENSTCDLRTHDCWHYHSHSKSLLGSSATSNQFNGSGGVDKYECIDKESKKYEEFRDESWGMVSYREKVFKNSINSVELGLGMVRNQLLYFGSDGKRYELIIGNKDIKITYANENNKETQGCEVFPVKLHGYRKCFFCPLIGVVYDGISKIADRSFATSADALVLVLAIGFAVWIAMQALSHVSSLTKQDAPKFLGNLLKQGYKVLIAILLLQSSSQIYKYVVNPILEAGLTFGQNMLTERSLFKDSLEENGKYLRQARVVGGNLLTVDTYDKIERYVVEVQMQISFMQAVGTSLICVGGNYIMLKGYSFVDGAKDAAISVAHKIGLFEGSKQTFYQRIATGFEMLIQGAILAIFGFLLSLAFVFYIIDAVVQIGVVGALMPLLIAFWPFKVTAKFTGTGFNMLLNSAFLFLFLGFVVTANIKLVDAALGNNVVMNNSPISQESADEDINFGALQKIALALNDFSPEKLRELTNITTVGFLILLFCCIFGFKFTSQALPLANKFASGGLGKPLAPGIATMGASFSKNMALNSTKKIRDSVENKVERGVDRVISGTAHLPVRGYRKIRNIFNKDKSSGKDEKQDKTEPTPKTNAALGEGIPGSSGVVNNGKPEVKRNNNNEEKPKDRNKPNKGSQAENAILSEKADGKPEEQRKDNNEQNGDRGTNANTEPNGDRGSKGETEQNGDRGSNANTEQNGSRGSNANTEPNGGRGSKGKTEQNGGRVNEANSRQRAVNGREDAAPYSRLFDEQQKRELNRERQQNNHRRKKGSRSNRKYLKRKKH